MYGDVRPSAFGNKATKVQQQQQVNVKDIAYLRRTYRGREVVVFIDKDDNFYTNFDNTKCAHFSEALQKAYEKINQGDF